MIVKRSSNDYVHTLCLPWLHVWKSFSNSSNMPPSLPLLQYYLIPGTGCWALHLLLVLDYEQHKILACTTMQNEGSTLSGLLLFIVTFQNHVTSPLT